MLWDVMGTLYGMEMFWETVTMLWVAIGTGQHMAGVVWDTGGMAGMWRGHWDTAGTLWDTTGAFGDAVGTLGCNGDTLGHRAMHLWDRRGYCGTQRDTRMQ